MLVVSNIRSPHIRLIAGLALGTTAAERYPARSSRKRTCLRNRLDARARICVMLLDIYERLPRNGLNSGLTFNLPLTQEQMGDHLGLTLVHVNRTLRRLREQRIVLIERQTVIILDLARLRECAEGLPQVADLHRSMAD